MQEYSENVCVDDDLVLKADLRVESDNDFLQLVYDVAAVLFKEMVQRGLQHTETYDELELIASREI